MTTHHPYQQSHLPPSPPPSPPNARRRHKKKKHDDPLLDLNTPIPSPTLSASFEQDAQDAQEPLINKILLTPILFTSFLVSLFLINLRDRAYRLSEHHSSANTLLNWLSPSTWLDPEPYQDPSDSRWDRRESTSHVEPHSVLNPQQSRQDKSKNRKRGSWHLTKKIRKVAKMEVSDAFEMRGRVIVVMVSVWIAMGLAMFWILRWVWRKAW